MAIETKAIELNLSDVGQRFAGVATIRAALFDALDVGCRCDGDDFGHPWEIDNTGDDERDDDTNMQRQKLVDAVLARIAELQTAPHYGIRIENLCDAHKRRVLPVPTAAVCGMCQAERSNRGNSQT